MTFVPKEATTFLSSHFLQLRCFSFVGASFPPRLSTLGRSSEDLGPNKGDAASQPSTQNAFGICCRSPNSHSYRRIRLHVINLECFFLGTYPQQHEHRRNSPKRSRPPKLLCRRVRLSVVGVASGATVRKRLRTAYELSVRSCDKRFCVRHCPAR